MYFQKKKQAFLIALSIVLAGIITFAALLNRNISNKELTFDHVDYGEVELGETLVFSHPGGFYNQDFLLDIYAVDENMKIFYTLDGSEPTPESSLYKNPIKINDRKKDKDVYSRISEIAEGYWPPLQPVNKAMVVRARAFSDDMPASEIVTQTYFVDVDMENRYTLPIISLTTDPYNLFDYNNGIYVKGKYYDDLFDPSQNSWEREGNFTQRGDEWERDVHIEFFESDGELGFSQNAGLRIHGGATRTYPQKSLRIYARSQYGESTIDYPIFEGRKIWDENNVADSFKRLILRNSGNDMYHTMFRDAMMQSLVEHTSLDIQAYRPVIVFLNGEYWGIYNIRERFDKHYFNSYYDIDENDLVFMENDGDLIEGTDEDKDYYRDMINYISTNSLEDFSNYEYITTLIDIDNFIDYYVANIFFDNTDWPGNNNRFWRVRRNNFDPDAPYGHDGRWRWVLYDTDFGFGLYGNHGGYENNTLIHTTKVGGTEWPNPDWSTFIFRNLLKNESFKNQFINTYADYLNTFFKSENVIKRIMDMKSVIEPEIDEHRKRWPVEGSWQGDIDRMIEFAQKRPDIQRTQIISFFNLEGDSKIELDISDESKGYISINSIDVKPDAPGIDASAYPWTGYYFSGVPIKITAVSLDGYRFVRWEGDIEETDETINVSLRNDMKIRAVFE